MRCDPPAQTISPFQVERARGFLCSTIGSMLRTALSSAVISQAAAYFRGWCLTEDGRILASMLADHTLAETVRDLMQCVQAARDGVPGHSLFAMQCDLVLHRAAQFMPDVLVVRHTH